MEKVDFETAQQDCINRGFVLAQPWNKDQVEYVKNFIKQHPEFYSKLESKL